MSGLWALSILFQDQHGILRQALFHQPGRMQKAEHISQLHGSEGWYFSFRDCLSFFFMVYVWLAVKPSHPDFQYHACILMSALTLPYFCMLISCCEVYWELI
jgi:hypothetical protein